MPLFPTTPNTPPRPAAPASVPPSDGAVPAAPSAAFPSAVPSMAATPGASAMPAPADDAERARRLVERIRARFAATLVGQERLRESLIVTLVFLYSKFYVYFFIVHHTSFL